MQRAADFAQGMAQDYESLVVAGTCHDHRSGLNMGHCFYPGAPRWGTPFFKQVGAHRQDERINVPAQRATLCVKAFGMTIGVLVCLDLADYTSVAAAIGTIDLDLLLVPAYTRRFEDLEKIASSTSKAMPGMVALVNYRQSANKPNAIVTELGTTVGDLPAAKELSKGAAITILDIDRNSLEEGQQEREDEVLAADGEEQEDQMTWLFGTRARYPQRFRR